MLCEDRNVHSQSVCIFNADSQRLDLRKNKLDELPSTMEYLFALGELLLGGNNLSRLPEAFALPNLSILYAEQNRIKELPSSLTNCTKLTRLNLANNPVGPDFWSLVAHLPNLVELQPIA